MVKGGGGKSLGDTPPGPPNRRKISPSRKKAQGGAVGAVTAALAELRSEGRLGVTEEPLAASALALAATIDSDPGARDLAAVAKELRATMGELTREPDDADDEFSRIVAGLSSPVLDPED